MFKAIFFHMVGGRVGKQLVEGDYVSRDLSDVSNIWSSNISVISHLDISHFLGTWCIG